MSSTELPEPRSLPPRCPPREPRPGRRGGEAALGGLPGLTLTVRSRPPAARRAAARAVRARARRLLAELVGADGAARRTGGRRGARPARLRRLPAAGRRQLLGHRARPRGDPATSTRRSAAPSTSSATRWAARSPPGSRPSGPTWCARSPWSRPRCPSCRRSAPPCRPRCSRCPGVAALFTRLTKDWTAEQRTRGVMALCYGDPGTVSPEAASATRSTELERRLELPYFWDAMARSARGIVNAYTLGGQHALWRQAERVLAPTLLVYGGRDQLVSYRMARRAAAAFRDSRLLTLPDAGHVAMMEYPETVARAFRELLDETASEELIRGVGRHSRKGPQPQGARERADARTAGGRARRGPAGSPAAAGARRAADAPPGTDGHTPFQGVPQVRGGHPERREPGGGWGAGTRQRYGDWQIPARARPPVAQVPRRPGHARRRPRRDAGQTVRAAHRLPRTPSTPSVPAAARPVERQLIPGPRREFVDAFDAPARHRSRHPHRAPRPLAGRSVRTRSSSGTSGPPADDATTGTAADAKDGQRAPRAGRSPVSRPPP